MKVPNTLLRRPCRQRVCTLVFVLTGTTFAISPVNAQETPAIRLDPITVISDQDGPDAQGVPEPRDATLLPPVYPGGQVSRGARAGMLGNRNIMDLPFAITAYTSEFSENTQPRSLADVAELDPSVTVTFPGSSYRDVMRIRGFDFFTYNMTFDGLPGMLPKQRVLAENAERIEIIKGPDTFINGVATGQTVGGSINFVPKRAESSPVHQLTLGVAGQGQAATHIDYGRRFGREEKFGVRSNLTLRDGNLAVDDLSERVASGTIALDYDVEDLRLTLDAGLQKIRTESPEWTFTLAPGQSVPGAPEGAESLSQPWAEFETEDSFAVIGGEWDFTPGWSSYAKVGISRTASEGIFIAGTNLASDGSFTASGRSFPSGALHHSAEAGLRGRVLTGNLQHDLSFAASLWRQEAKVGFSFLPLSAPSNIYEPVTFPEPDLSGAIDLDDLRTTSRNRFSSFAFADTLSLADDRLLLTLGSRLQRIRSDSFNGITGARRARYDDKALTPAVGVVWRPLPELSFYGNYVEALQQGPTAPAGTLNVGEVFAPTVSKQLEAGVRYDFGKWATSLALFEITQPNGITDPTTNLFGVDGEQRNRGIELSVQGEPQEGFRLLGGVTGIDADMTETAGGLRDGNAAIGVPQLKASLGAEWDLPQIEGLTLLGRVIHTTSQYVDARNTQKLPAWTRLDIGLRYAIERPERDPIVFRLGVENLLDNDYWASAATGQVRGISRGAPRTVSLSTSFRF